MYNEVFKKCPKCNGTGIMQISQIVLGFGGFNLDNPESIARELSLSDIKTLKEYVEDGKYFTCEECDNTFHYSDQAEKDEINEKLSYLKNWIK